MKEITSEESPLRVDFLPDGAAGAPGRVGLTIAPGKKAPGIDVAWRRDLDLDLARLRATWRADVLVSLCEADELRRLEIGDLHACARAAGIDVVPFPFPDGGTPASSEAVAALATELLGAVAAGRTVVIHCRGGLGRSGLIAACLLVARGTPPEEAMITVRKARPGAIENRGQEAFVRAFAATGSR